MTVQKNLLVKARHLKPKDRVALVCPGSRPHNPAVVQRSAKIVEELGFIPVVGKHVLKIDGFTAGTDEERLEDLTGFFADDSIAGIFCITGGHGSLNLLDKLDYGLIAKNPKVLVGSDDNSAWLLAVHCRTNLVVILGPNMDRIVSKASFEKFRDVVTTTAPLPVTGDAGDDLNFLAYPLIYTPVSGRVTGRLLGGNITSIMSLMGTPFEQSFADKILFLDERGERLDILDRWFTNFYVSGQLAKSKGIMFGSFDGCGSMASYNQLSLEDMFGDRLKELNKPFCFGVPVGSNRDPYALPIGIEVELDCGLGRLEFLESALVS